MVGLDTYDKAGWRRRRWYVPEQVAWFMSDFAAHKDQPTVVFGHHPLVMKPRRGGK